MDPQRTKLIQRLRQLHEAYMDVHLDGVTALREGDYTRFGEAIRHESLLIDERKKLWDQFIASPGEPVNPTREIP